MFDDSRAFVTRAFLRAEFELEFRAYIGGGLDQALLQRLEEWDRRLQLSEVQAEGAFIQTFFVDTWGYGEAGRVPAEDQTIVPKLRIGGEGAGGGAGEADLALGWFAGDLTATPQVLCEFKDIRSKLDARQNRKGSNRSPVEQCLNYVRGARRGLIGNEPVQPWWGIVTNMNEFRLYWWDRAPTEYLRFVIRRTDLFAGEYDLLGGTDEARFDRFLFWKLFQRDYLLSKAGRPPLLRLIERQWIKERALEGEFYDHYKGVRDRLFNVLRLSNPGFRGTPTELLRLTQALLDRFIFAFYCEDMGERMLFPPQMIRDHLRGRSVEPYYDPNGNDFWQFFRRLFTHMNDGGMFGQLKVPLINGGLFAPNAAMDALEIPNHVFAAAKQGAGEAMLEDDPETLLYLCARYNYAARGNVRESLSLYTLGRIFEQSITELEYRAGELEDRESVAKLSKRKRDGVYYTPEWVVNMLVEQSMGSWFSAARTRAGYTADESAPPDQASAIAYQTSLQAMRIVDPACGSGAFLISAFRRLLEERKAVARDIEHANGRVLGAISEPPLIAEILANNIYGVDINPASVEITKLALWLHSARADNPLSSLDHTIRCGNSLVGMDYWRGRVRDPEIIEYLNAFDWAAAFPEVAIGQPDGGFDIVLGNPPYVKLQNLMKVDPHVVAYLQANRGDETYLSAQTGNTDLYLPFIEKGLRLLALGGRMGFIAPSLWTVNDYGEGLRRLIKRTRQLERWVDFKSFQVFDDVTTYTALQYFTKEPNNSMLIAVAPGGEAEAQDVEWSDLDLAVPYAAFPDEGEWLMATGAQRALIDRLAEHCLRFDDAQLTDAIFQGLITSADHIYHLARIGRGRYKCKPKGAPAYVVEIEDAVMKPLISGSEAKRYEEPQTDTYILFPYEREPGGAMRLMPGPEIERRFPNAWRHLRSFEEYLRAREGRKFDDDQWYRFGRNQNLDKQDHPKLVVPRIVQHLKVCADATGMACLDNVDVGGVLAADTVDLNYLLGVLNGPVADFVFRIRSKPFQNDYRSANKQFIAPLPIPDASPADRAGIGARALPLQQAWTDRRNLLVEAAERLSVLPRDKKPSRWLWPDLPDLPETVARAPAALKSLVDRRAWADAELDSMEQSRVEALQAALDSGELLAASFDRGELRLTSGGAAVLSRIYLNNDAGFLTEAYWRYLLLSAEPGTAEKFAAKLRNPPSPLPSPAAFQFTDRVRRLTEATDLIEVAEREMDEKLFELYRLTAAERHLVENARR